MVLVRNLEGDLGTGAGSHEARDRHRPRIVLDVGDQRVVRRIDGRKPAQLLITQPGLGAVEARPPRVLAEPLEDGLDRGSVAVPEGPDEEPRPMLRLHDTRVHAYSDERPPVGSSSGEAKERLR